MWIVSNQRTALRAAFALCFWLIVLSYQVSEQCVHVGVVLLIDHASSGRISSNKFLSVFLLEASEIGVSSTDYGRATMGKLRTDLLYMVNASDVHGEHFDFLVTSTAHDVVTGYLVNHLILLPPEKGVYVTVTYLDFGISFIAGLPRGV